ncbi:MAG TPA: CHASE sensor domain-containing protein [Opitutus sp.]|nr:CHASE sensor domain-containing protein [Opitutus sp.]
MKRLRDLPIRRKLTLVMLLVSAAALLLATGGFVAYDVARFRHELVDRTESLATVVGNNTTAALAFNDPSSAAETLAALRDEPHVVAAWVYDPAGKVFALYVRPGTSARPPGAAPSGHVHYFSHGELLLFRPIVHQDETLGTIAIASDLSGLLDRLERYAAIVGLMLSGALLLVFTLSFYFQRVLTRPLLQLSALARAAAVDGNYANRAEQLTSDEIGQLVADFNEMLARIQARDAALQDAQASLEQRVADRTAALIRAQEDAARVHRQLLDISRQAGMAEVATGVLHNVGNVLNSVNISTQLIREKLQHSSLGLLARSAGLIRDHQEHFAEFVTDDPKGRLLPGFIVTLATALHDEHAVLAREVQQLVANIDHIKEIVVAQQSFARIAGVIETLAARDLFAEAVNLARASLLQHRVDITEDYAATPDLTVDRQRVLQILVNFISNAVHAVRSNPPGQRRVTLRIAARPQGVALAVADNGVGISAENLDRIFTHGFTTRHDGHGFGLHSGALAARALGGRVHVVSAGLGQGATFTLELPVTPEVRLASES